MSLLFPFFCPKLYLLPFSEIINKVYVYGNVVSIAAHWSPKQPIFLNLVPRPSRCACERVREQLETKPGHGDSCEYKHPYSVVDVICRRGQPRDKFCVDDLNIKCRCKSQLNPRAQLGLTGTRQMVGAPGTLSSPSHYSRNGYSIINDFKEHDEDGVSHVHTFISTPDLFSYDTPGS